MILLMVFVLSHYILNVLLCITLVDAVMGILGL